MAFALALGATAPDGAEQWRDHAPASASGSHWWVTRCAKLGTRVEHRSELLSGVVLISVGAAILTNLL